MVFSQHVRRTPIEIWRTPGRKAAPRLRAPQRLIHSSQDDAQPAYSPDGKRIAFWSSRGGTPNIWVSEADGSRPAQLTALKTSAGSPHWSPDSRQIVFDSSESGNADIYVVDAAGGVPRRLTLEPTEEIVPSYSRDNRSVYFSSDRGGRREIWRMPADGGPAGQVTKGGGYYGEESWDGRFFYFTRNHRDPVLWRVPVSGGVEIEVLRGPEVYSWWAVSRSGIYYATERRLVDLRAHESTVHFFDFRSRRAVPLFTQAGPVRPWALTVSPDEEWIARHQYPMSQAELMLVENFR